MTGLDLLRRLFAHNDWADARILDALRAGEPDAEAARLFHHVLAAEHLWHARVQGTPPRVAVWPTLTRDEAEALSRDNRDGYARLLAAADDPALARVVTYVNSAGTAYHSTLADVLTHVALHGHYHRGQIASRMRLAGQTPAYTDYIGWARRDQ